MSWISRAASMIFGPSSVTPTPWECVAKGHTYFGSWWYADVRQGADGLWEGRVGGDGEYRKVCYGFDTREDAVRDTRLSLFQDISRAYLRVWDCEHLVEAGPERLELLKKCCPGIEVLWAWWPESWRA
jgi:hypothetical protein